MNIITSCIIYNAIQGKEMGKEILEMIENYGNEKYIKNERYIICGDFNIRIGELGGEEEERLEEVKI